MEKKNQQTRTLEINLQSGKDLNKVNLITKMDIYAVVSISGTDNNQKTKTPVDRLNDANPSWNFPIKFTLDETALQQNLLTLDFKLVCERAFGDKDVGEVHVPIKELLDSTAKPAADGKRFVSYQVRKPSGRAKGQLTFSYTFTDIVSPYAAVPPPPSGGLPIVGKFDQEPVTAYPAGPSMAYPPPPSGLYPPPPMVAAGGSYYPPPSTGLYPQVGSSPPKPHHGYVYPPPVQQQQQGYVYPPPPPPHGYGYPPPPPPHGYGYPPPLPPVQQAQRKNRFGGMGLGAGLMGGAIGGLLIGDVISDASGGFDCGGGFDF